MNIHERLQRLLEERGWTEYRLAKESDLSESTIAHIFRRNATPSFSTLESICSGLGITLSQFFAEYDMVELSPELKELFDGWVRAKGVEPLPVLTGGFPPTLRQTP